MNAVLSSIKKIFSLVHHKMGAVINFIISIPVYFIGAGLSRLFYRKEKNKNMKSYWEDILPKSNQTEEDLERLF